MKKRELRELKELIEQGEGYFVEFKEQIGVSLDKEMVAFANASGGKIVIGVADNGKIGSGINRMRQAMAVRNIEVEVRCRVLIRGVERGTGLKLRVSRLSGTRIDRRSVVDYVE